MQLPISLQRRRAFLCGGERFSVAASVPGGRRALLGGPPHLPCQVFHSWPLFGPGELLPQLAQRAQSRQNLRAGGGVTPHPPTAYRLLCGEALTKCTGGAWQ
jgi:hypothetical protein